VQKEKIVKEGAKKAIFAKSFTTIFPTGARCLLINELGENFPLNYCSPPYMGENILMVAYNIHYALPSERAGH
jgi:hypothetical protein